MARPTWKGSITFGLVDIPVALYPAEERNDLSFTQLDRRDLAPVGYKRVNKSSGEEVPWGDIVKGYEYEPEQYVILGPGDFQKANAEMSKTIEIQDFVPSDDIDPVYFETPYYVEPVRKDSKGYALLREALKRTGKIGIAQFVLRTRQYLAALVPRGRILVLNLLRYQQELRKDTGIEAPPADIKKAKVSERELEMATQLVEGMTSDWDPERYHDTWADDLHAVIQKKIKSGKVHEITEPDDEDDAKPKAEIHDLTRLLQRSIDQGGKARKSPAKAAPKKKTPAKKRHLHAVKPAARKRKKAA